MDEESALSNNNHGEARLAHDQQEMSQSRQQRLDNQRLLKQYLDRLLYLPDVGSGCENKDKDILDQTLIEDRDDSASFQKSEEGKQATSERNSAEFRVESEIAPNLQEVQQEEEIICMDEVWQRHHMTFAEDEDSEKEQVAEAAQYATRILNKSFICDKTVDVTANFQQDDEDEKESSSCSQNQEDREHQDGQEDQQMSRGDENAEDEQEQMLDLAPDANELMQMEEHDGIEKAEEQE